MMQKINKQLVKKILEEANSYKWSLQGLGMLRLYLSDEVRLHVWDDSYKAQGVSPLHDHPWDFKSTVVAGVVRQFRFDEGNFEDSMHRPFNCATIKCGEGACTLEEPKKVFLHGNYEEYHEGDIYVQKKNEVHESFPVSGTVTIVERVFHPNRDNARVFWRGNGPFVSAEPRPATEDEVLLITQNALNRWF